MAQIQIRIAAIGALGTPTPSRPAAAASATPFANIFADAVGATGAPAAVGGGRLTADGIPVDLATYGNGKVPEAALREVGKTGHRLWAPAAASLGSLLEAARRDGVSIGITDSYRSYAEQVDIARRKGLYSRGGLAAKPGTSDHGWGLSVDLNLDARAQAWMKVNGVRYGFVADVPREPWHWTYTPKA